MANETKLGDGLKKLLLAGIGAAATTAEKSSEIIDQLAKKGEITVAQGKELNRELKHNVKNTIKKNVNKGDGTENLGEKLASMSIDELEALKGKIDSLQEKLRAQTSRDSSKEDDACSRKAEEDEACACETDKSEACSCEADKDDSHSSADDQKTAQTASADDSSETGANED